MLTGRFTEARRIQLVETAEPSLLDEGTDEGGEIIFQPELTCLCGSDLPFFDGAFEGHEIVYPQPDGKSLHEMVGTVVATNGDRWRIGERVLAVPLHQMGLSERFVLSENRAIALDERISDEVALMAQPFGTVLFALKKLPNMIDRDVVVIGQGPIGLMFVAGLRNLGARRIIAVDLIQDRLAVSSTMGATDVICNEGLSTDELQHRMLQATGGEHPEVIIEAVGHKAQALNLCIDLCALNGMVLFFGVPPQTIDGVNWLTAMHRNLTIRTSLHPDFERTFPLAMQWIAEGRVDLRPLVTHRYSLDRIQEAFDLFRDRRDGVIKVLVEFPAWKGET